MSKHYKQYSNLKKEDPDRYYLFKSGLFYIFIGDDAVKASNLLGLKCTKLTDDIYKCGFPVNSLEKYMKRIDLLHLNLTIVDQGQSIQYDKNYLEDTRIIEFIQKLKKIDVNELTPLKSLELLYDLKGVIDCD